MGAAKDETTWTEAELVAELDRHEPYDSDRGVSRCPWCGDLIGPYEHVVTIDGRTGIDANLTAIGLHVRTYHPRCRRKRTLVRRAIENERITDFLSLG